MKTSERGRQEEKKPPGRVVDRGRGVVVADQMANGWADRHLLSESHFCVAGNEA